MTLARRFVMGLLGGYPEEIRDRIELIVSELATNALRHTGMEFLLAVNTTDADIRVDVSDAGPGRPEIRSPSPWEPSGRGLHIVDTLADRWEVTPGPGGKTVSFVVELPADTTIAT